MDKKDIGLSNEQAEKILNIVGKNLLPEAKKISIFSVYLSQLKNPLIYILILASLVSVYLKDYLNSFVILAAVAINSLLGFVQEYKAKKSLEKLKGFLSETSKVIRNGELQRIKSQMIVPGDVVMVSLGDKIPADSTVFENVKLYVDESFLTGESVAVEKKEGDFVLGGSIVMSGRATIKIEKTGKESEIGKIAKELQVEKEEKTPLQKKLENLAKTLALIVIVLSALVFVVGLIKSEDPLTIFTTSLAVAVSAIPEGLAVSLTAILAVGMQRILKRKAIVRKLISAETLGSVTLIATDKTGTLTEGHMKITQTHITDKNLAIKTAILANNTETPIEIAMRDWIRQNNTDPDLIEENTKRDEEIPFSSETKMMAVKVGGEIFVKGAPEIIINKCILSDNEKSALYNILHSYSSSGLHTIALGYKNINDNQDESKAPKNLNSNLNNLKFLGILGAEDPVRDTVVDAIQNCKKAGVKVAVITGDFQKTAEYVLRQIGLEIKNPADEIIDGKELEELDEKDLESRIKNIKLFARVSPHQKLKIVKAYKSIGEVVAVTGDGVNDALALKEADIGLVVNSASDVAKDTADIILLDSNFSTIVSAIEEGRGIFDNIRKVTLYLISDVFSEITIILTSIVLGLPLPLTAAQILWINIIGDGLPNLALTVEPKSKNLLNRPPANKNEPFLNNQMKSLIIIISLISGLFTVLIFTYYLNTTHDLELARSIAFTLQAVDSLIYVFAARALTKPIYKVNPFKNPSLIVSVAFGFLLQFVVIYNPVVGAAFNTRALTVNNWLFIATLSTVVIITIEITKAMFRQRLFKGFSSNLS